MLTPPNSPNYVVEGVILSQVGPVSAVVHAILAANEADGVTQMTHQQLATAAGIPVIKARRALDQLREAGLLKREPQFRHSMQKANLYLIPSSAPPAHSEQAYIDMTNQVVSDSPTLSLPPREDINGLSFSKENIAIPLPGGGLRPPGVMTPRATNPEGGVGNPGESPTHPRISPTTPPPVASRGEGPWLNLLDIFEQAFWLVAHFEVPVLATSNQERQARGRKFQASVGDHRLTLWLRSAVALLHSHSLDVVVRVIDWVFNDRGGFLAEHLVDDQERKLTRIQQIVDCYDGLVAEMTMGLPPSGGTSPRQPKVHYGKPLADEAMEAKVTELVLLFGEFRTSCGDREIADFRTWGWAKTLRIMLGKRSFEDIKAAILALDGCRGYEDPSRYHDAFDLNREGEWEQLQSLVDLHKVIQGAAK
jgi:hypothetical protein